MLPAARGEGERESRRRMLAEGFIAKSVGAGFTNTLIIKMNFLVNSFFAKSL